MLASASGSSGGGSPVDLISLAQKMYLTSLIAIKNFPENYGAFAGELNWAVFNVDTPWEKAKNLEEELKVRLNSFLSFSCCSECYDGIRVDIATDHGTERECNYYCHWD